MSLPLLLVLLRVCTASESRFWCEETSSGLCNFTSEDATLEDMEDFVRHVSSWPRLKSSQVDSSTIKRKVFAGYQGWSGSDDKWKHWFNGGKPDAAHAHFEMIPSMDEYPASTKRATKVKYTTGKTLSLFENAREGVVDLHFKWMEDYGLDGIFLQRFGDTGHNNQILAQVDAAAQKHGRIYAVEWDIGQRSDHSWDKKIKDDFNAHIKKYVHSSRYIKENGKPVVVIFGIGLASHSFATASTAKALIQWLQGQGLYVVGSGPYYWRTGNKDALRGFEAVHAQFDAIMPWSVGRYNAVGKFAEHQVSIAADAAATSQRGQGYAPIAFPGYSYRDTNKFNKIKRSGGTFLQSQIDYYLKLDGATFFNIAMFDEVQEGTAIYKFAASKEESCQGAQWVTADIDGVKVPSDHYLTMAGHFAQAAKAGSSHISLRDIVV
jgi:hypothetical protein